MEGMKNCCTCKHSTKLSNEEPCKSCQAHSKWESNVKFKTGDIVVSKNDPYKKNLYIFMRNKWVLYIPYNVVINGVLCDYHLSNRTIDELIGDRGVVCTWLDDIEYASPEMVMSHDVHAASMIYNSSLNDWLSEILEKAPEEPKKESLKDLYKRCFPNPESLTVAIPNYSPFDRVKNSIKNVIFSDPATIIFWEDGTKTVVKTQDGEKYDKEKGFAMAVCKKVFGNERDYYHVFKRWMRKGKEVK